MELIVKNFDTSKGVVKGMQLKWENSWLFIVEAPKGSVTCGSFDVDALNGFGLPVAKVLPKPDNPALTIEDFISRKVTHSNELASNLGVKIGMGVLEAVEKLF